MNVLLDHHHPFHDLDDALLFLLDGRLSFYDHHHRSSMEMEAFHGRRVPYLDPVHDVQAVVDNPVVPYLDLVVDTRTVGIRMPYEVVDILDRVDILDTVDNQPCEEASRMDFHHIHVVEEDILEVFVHHHPLLVVLEVIHHTHEEAVVDNHIQVVVVAHLAYI